MLGLVFGYFVSSVEDLFSGDVGVQQILASGATTPDELTALFLRTILSLIGIIAAVPGVQVLLKLRAEELADRVDPVMAGAVTRTRYFASNVLLALAACTVYVLLAGVLVALLASSADVDISFTDAFLQAVATVPAVWTVVTVSVAIVGARPVLSLAAWAGVLAAFGLTLLGPTFGLDDWVLGVSPFWHVPVVTAAVPDLSGLGWISLVTAVLAGVGFVGFRRRDLAR